MYQCILNINSSFFPFPIYIWHQEKVYILSTPWCNDAWWDLTKIITLDKMVHHHDSVRKGDCTKKNTLFFIFYFLKRKLDVFWCFFVLMLLNLLKPLTLFLLSSAFGFGFGFKFYFCFCAFGSILFLFFGSVVVLFGFFIKFVSSTFIFLFVYLFRYHRLFVCLHNKPKMKCYFHLISSRWIGWTSDIGHGHGLCLQIGRSNLVWNGYQIIIGLTKLVLLL